MPLPLSDTVCEAIEAANATVSIAVAEPEAVGLNVTTLTVQLPLGASFLLLQAVPAAKGAGAVTWGYGCPLGAQVRCSAQTQHANSCQDQPAHQAAHLSPRLFSKVHKQRTNRIDC